MTLQSETEVFLKALCLKTRTSLLIHIREIVDLTSLLLHEQQIHLCPISVNAKHEKKLFLDVDEIIMYLYISITVSI